MSPACRPPVHNVPAQDLTHAHLCLSDYAFPYIILVLSLVTLAVYMSASEIQVKTPAAFRCV